MKSPGKMRMILLHLALAAVTFLTLYPVLWVVKILVPLMR